MTAAKAAYIQEGKTLNIKVEADKGYNAVVPIGNDHIGITLESILANASGSVATEGVWALPATGTSAIAVGDQLYWDDTNQCLTLASSDNAKAGIAVEAMASGGTKAKVKIG